MARTEDELDRVRLLEAKAETKEGKRGLAKALASRSSPVVARAAKIVREHRVFGLERELFTALERFYSRPVKTDPGCTAKIALLEVVVTQDLRDVDVLIRAARHVQLEPAWGPPVDTAAGLRALAAMGLSGCVHEDVLIVLAELLGDPLESVQRAAVLGLEERGLREGAAPLVLMLKLRPALKEPLVVEDCLRAAIRLAPEAALPLGVEMLRSRERVEREVGAFALGESRHPEAVEPLLEWVREQVFPEEQKLGFAALVLHRSPRAWAHVVERVRDGTQIEAEMAIRSLEAFAHDDQLRSDVEEAAESGFGATLNPLIQEIFG